MLCHNNIFKSSGHAWEEAEEEKRGEGDGGGAV
jgi:hypothetical protein